MSFCMHSKNLILRSENSILNISPIRFTYFFYYFGWCYQYPDRWIVEIAIGWWIRSIIFCSYQGIPSPGKTSWAYRLSQMIRYFQRFQSDPFWSGQSRHSRTRSLSWRVRSSWIMFFCTGWRETAAVIEEYFQRIAGWSLNRSAKELKSD